MCATEPLFETAWLRVRRWGDDDLDALHAVYGDPEAMRWVGDGRPLTPERCREWLAVTRTNFERRGYGMFAVEVRPDGPVVGFCGLVHPGGQAEPEVKYAFRRSCWGRGYAGEVVPALLHHGLRAHGLGTIVATVAAGNRASQRVMDKAGARRVRVRPNDDGSTTWVYEWNRPAEGAAPQPVEVVEVDPQGAEALALLREAAEEARALYPELFPPGTPWPGNGPTPERGVYLVARQSGRTVACGALRPLGPDVAEVRRIFVTRDARRRGLAAALLAELERRALPLGYAVLRLETGFRQQPAQALYASRGYARIAPFGAYADDPTSVCFEKPLAGAVAGRSAGE